MAFSCKNYLINIMIVIFGCCWEKTRSGKRRRIGETYSTFIFMCLGNLFELVKMKQNKAKNTYKFKKWFAFFSSHFSHIFFFVVKL